MSSGALKNKPRQKSGRATSPSAVPGTPIFPSPQIPTFPNSNSIWIDPISGALAGLEIISRLAPVKLSGQTYFCSDTTHFWPDKYPLRHISIKFSPPHPHMMFTYQTSTFSTPLLYMQPRTHCRKSGTHGVTAMFGKIIITFVHTNIASVPCLLYGEILIPTKVMKLMKLKLAM